MAYSSNQQIPGDLLTVNPGDTNVKMGGNSFTICWTNEATTVVAKPVKGENQTFELPAFTPLPANLKEIISTTGTIIIGY